ncbi:MAG: sterol desaturase family protein [Geminicoccaceae bacterium]
MAKPKTTTDEHGQVRDRRGEWRSGRPVYLEPLLDDPANFKKIFNWLTSFPGFFVPWFALYMIVIGASFVWFTPAMERMQALEFGWMAEILLRNLVILWIWNGAFHLWFYSLKMQGRLKKYNANWQSTESGIFLFNDQVYDNVFWAPVGLVIWTAYESMLWWGYANNWLPYLEPSEHPIIFGLLMMAVPFWRNFHFYWIHRLIHWKPLYDYVHYLHHKNVNVGPWSGLAMHPVEHLLYFSCMLIHLVVPSHPLHMLFNGFQTGLGPAVSHSGFDEIVFGDEKVIQNDRYMHYLHHRYHNVNYGESNVPLDKWFGSLHDGSPEADAHFRRVHSERVKAGIA